MGNVSTRGAVMRQARVAANLSQRDAAARLGIQRGTLVDLERCKWDVSPAQLAEARRAYGEDVVQDDGDRAESGRAEDLIPQLQ